MQRPFRVGEWTVEPHRDRIVRGARRVRLEPRAMQVLVYLAERAGTALNREELLTTIWDEKFITDEVLTNAIVKLRKALGDDVKDPRYIQTVPNQGYRLIADVDRGENDLPSEPKETAKPGRAALWWASAGAMAGGLVVAAILWSSRPSSPDPTTPLTIQLPAGGEYFYPTAIAVSPRGDQVAFFVRAEGRIELFVRSISQLEATPISGPQTRYDVAHPRKLVFSPDGEWVAYFADGKLWKAAVGGGLPVPICDAPSRYGVHWGPEDTIVFAAPSAEESTLMRVRASGGTPEPVTIAAPGEFYMFPQILPGGDAILFAVRKSTYDRSIAVLDLTTGQKKTLLEGDVPLYVSTGHLLYASGDSVLAAPFDVERLELTGPAVRVLDDIQVFFNRPTNEAAFAVSTKGTLVYAPSVPLPEQTLALVDRSGKETLLDLRPRVRGARRARLSPDGRRLVMADGEDVWIYDLERGTSSVLRSEGSVESRPLWTRDGEHVVFASNRDLPGLDLFIQRADGSEPARKLVDARQGRPMEFSPDGDTLLYLDPGAGGPWDVWALPMRGAGQPWRFLDGPYAENWPSFSPDGRWVAYESNETGEWEVYVRRFPGGDGKQTISTRGNRPVWVGNEIFYWHDDSLMAVPILGTEPTLVTGERELLLVNDSKAPAGLGLPRFYDVHPDGQSFLLHRPTSELRAPTHLVVVQNWFEKLQRLAPTP